VVGSSASLRATSWGEEIDHADVVVRVNRAPVRGWERQVGSRTTHRVWGSLPLPYQSGFDGSEAIIIYCPPVKWMGECWKRIPQRPDVRFHPQAWQVVHRAARFEQQGAQNQKPTSGAMAVLFALSICERPTVFGFGAGHHRRAHGKLCAAAHGHRNCTMARLCGRYYDQNLGECQKRIYYHDAATFHNFSVEWAWLSRLHRAGAIDWRDGPAISGPTVDTGRAGGISKSSPDASPSWKSPADKKWEVEPKPESTTSTTVTSAKTTKIGPADTTKTFVVNGYLYATTIV